MYKVDCTIKSVSNILQHRFSAATLEASMTGSTKSTGAKDYSLEWMDTMYAHPDGYLYQPASHIEGALQKSAVSFKIKGRGTKTWKDPIKAYCYVLPDEIPLLYENGDGLEALQTPDETLLTDPTANLIVDIRPVKVQRARIARSRLMIKDWRLSFVIEVHDDQVRSDVLQTILEEAGRAVGIGDYRPRYGRFEVVKFEVGEDV